MGTQRHHAIGRAMAKAHRRVQLRSISTEGQHINTRVGVDIDQSHLTHIGITRIVDQSHLNASRMAHCNVYEAQL